MKILTGLILFISLQFSGTFLIAQDINITITEFKVSGNCDMCKKTIESSLKGITGIESAVWNKGTKKIKVTYNPLIVSLNDIHQKIADAGYDTEVIKADEKAYTNLHHCCQYKRILHK